MVLLVLPVAVVLQAAAVRKPLLFLHLAKVAAKEQLVPKARGLRNKCRECLPRRNAIERGFTYSTSLFESLISFCFLNMPCQTENWCPLTKVGDSSKIPPSSVKQRSRCDSRLKR